MRILIVDDEAPARARLRRLLAGIPGIASVQEAASAQEAQAVVATEAPDLLLLDVQMPQVSGLDLAASLPDPAPAVVFVTAHDQYALRAFEVAALDYLLKPIEPEGLVRALGRWQARSGPAGRRARPVPRQLLIPDRAHTHVVPLTEIRWLESADNYVVVHAQDRAPLLRRTLTGLLEDLGPGFVRVHRHAAVALAHVRAVHGNDKGDAVVALRDGDQVVCSRTHRSALMQRLQAG